MTCSQCGRIRAELAAAVLRGDVRGAGSKFQEGFMKLSRDVRAKTVFQRTSLQKNKNSVRPDDRRQRS
jgi:hypothetical protein